MLASSKVEIPSSASPFGFGLRNENWRERINRSCRESSNNVETAFQTSIKYFVQDHKLQTGISNFTPQRNPQNAGDLLVNKCNNTISNESKQSGGRKRIFSPDLSEDSTIDTQDPGCVSSLVQKWRKISDTRNINIKQSNPNSPSSSPSLSSNADACSAFQKSSNYRKNVSSISPKNTCDSIGENFDTPCNEKFDKSVAIGGDMFCDSDSDRVVQTELPSVQSRNSSCGETEKLRVADVIKKLKMENVKEIKVKEQENNCSSPVISSATRIRGRQAFKDLLMQLERDRHMELDKLVEHRAVSKFSHRGRIQSLLRLRSMCRETIVRNHLQQNARVVAPQQHSHPIPAAILQQPSSSEKSTNVDNPQIPSPSPMGIEAQKPEAIARKQEQMLSRSFSEQNSHSEATSIDGQCTQSLSSEPNHIGQGSTVVLLRKKFNILDKIDAATPKSSGGVAKNYIQCIKSSSSFNQPKEEFHQQEVADTAQTSCSSQESNHEPDNICSPEFEKMLTISNGWELIKGPEEVDQDKQGSSDQQILESGEWRSTDGLNWSQWYDEDTNNLNWVSEIARPKSDWENLRQERYRDMLDSDHENDEVRRLLERRSVSTFLTSKLRDTMDQLMISRVERVPQSRKDHDEQLEQFVRSQVPTQANIRKEGVGDSNFSDQVRYPSFEQPQSAQSSVPDLTHLSALTNRSSIDMDYMHELRAYMEQIQQEVSELRKAVNNCMNMQQKMQCCIKQEVSSAIDSSVRRDGQDSGNSTTRTRSCCLCYETQVDSLFYRCGHMCTCFKCAHELQWSTGKCPVCRAPIVDVVRVNPEVISLTAPNS